MQWERGENKQKTHTAISVKKYAANEKDQHDYVCLCTVYMNVRTEATIRAIYLRAQRDKQFAKKQQHFLYTLHV